MASSITKWEWLEDAVEAFNEVSKSDPNLQVNGNPIHVEVLLEKDPLTGRLRHWNSPTQVAATLRGEIKPTILSPASTTWLLKLNKEWRALYGNEITTGPAPFLVQHPGGHRHVGVPCQGPWLLACLRARVHLGKHPGAGRQS